jgi:hypothetical protein
METAARAAYQLSSVLQTQLEPRFNQTWKSDDIEPI